MKKIIMQSHLSSLSNDAYHILVTRLNDKQALVS
ncbi:Transcriptional regulator [Pseudomonas donghuensis]|uniref:Uncharacterized protein n=1 Tax=Pseudomonas wadenswilerensis TaxID=1785161 RepID=A0A380SWG8_9PSED|nr:hypothetical protein CCOS864_01074 [Pseudomonas wadenswilerensis]